MTSVPEGVKSLEITSQDVTWAAYGLGYRRKKARETMDQGSLNSSQWLPLERPSLISTHSYRKDCVKIFMANDPGFWALRAF